MTEKKAYNWPLIGNEHITDWLSRVAAENRIGGTYIFAGPDNLGKTTLAKALAQILLCEDKTEGAKPCRRCSSCRHFGESQINGQDSIAHADYHFIKKDSDKKNISISQIRGLIEVLSMSSFLNSYKIGIIKQADSLSTEAANALLKTLEEPREKVVVILMATDLDSLPSTIVSRAQVLNFRTVRSETIYDYLVQKYQAPRSEAKNISRMSLGRPALAVKFWEDKDFKEKYQAGADAMIAFSGQDINARFKALQDLVSGANNQEKGAAAKRLLEIWQGVLRDLLMIEYGHYNLVQHEAKQERLHSAKLLYSPARIKAVLESMAKARQMINDNVNPVLALESVVLEM